MRKTAAQLAYTLGQVLACHNFGLLKQSEDAMFSQDDDLQDDVQGDPQEEVPTPADELAQVLQQLDVDGTTVPTGAEDPNMTAERLNRETVWGNPANIDAGDTATRTTGFDTPTSSGKAF